MQQLIDGWCIDNHVIVAKLSLKIEQSMFVQWVDSLPKDHLTMHELSEGADRAQAHCEVDNIAFNLCFDGTCEAIWVETLGKNNQKCLEHVLNALTAIANVRVDNS